MPTILHITTRTQWDRAVLDGFYRGETLDTAGFIHCATSTQLAGVIARFYKGRTGLVLLEIDPAKLTSPLKFEPATDIDELFPHIYGPLNPDAVVSVSPLDPEVDGSLEPLPDRR
jgi:uncharacterized protein (DUF952 family)